MSNNLPSCYLTEEEIQEFIVLAKKDKGIDLTAEEALDQGTRLIMIFETMQRFKPIHSSYKDIVDFEGIK